MPGAKQTPHKCIQIVCMNIHSFNYGCAIYTLGCTILDHFGISFCCFCCSMQAFCPKFLTKGKEGWKIWKKRFVAGKHRVKPAWDVKNKGKTQRDGREGSKYHFISYIIIILHSPHMFSLHSTCQIVVTEGPSQQERDHLFPLLSDAGSGGWG